MGASFMQLTRRGGKQLLDVMYYGEGGAVLTTLFLEFLFRQIRKQG